MNGRPNILFLMSDEHRPDVVGYQGNSIRRLGHHLYQRSWRDVGPAWHC